MDGFTQTRFDTETKGNSEVAYWYNTGRPKLIIKCGKKIERIKLAEFEEAPESKFFLQSDIRNAARPVRRAATRTIEFNKKLFHKQAKNQASSD